MTTSHERTLERKGLARSRFLSVVVYLDAKTYREDPGVLDRELFPGKRLHFEYQVMKLWEIDPEPILANEAPGLWTFVPLLRGEPLDLVLRSRRKILGLPDTIASQEVKRQLLTILGGLATRVIGDRDLLRELLTEMGNMSDNWFLDELLEKRRAIVMEKGRELGLREGRVEGRVEGALQALFRFLERRFGELSPSDRTRIDHLDDLEEIERLAGEAAVAPTLESFLALVPPGPR